MFDKFFKVFVIVAITVLGYVYCTTVNYSSALYYIGIIFFITGIIVFILPLFVGIIQFQKDNKKK